jgi:serine/threonine protein kinase
MTPTSGTSEDFDGEFPLGDLQPGFLAGAGRFTLTERLDLSVHTTVWRATDNHLNEDVILKFFSVPLPNPAAANDMRSRIQLARKLSHPHIARTHDLYYVQGELPFVAEEYIVGVNLDAARKARANSIFTWADLHPVLTELCEALAYAHREGVVHGSLKPTKVILDSRYRVKLTGFGMPMVEILTASDVSSDALPYSSPQLLNDNPADPKDDVYSLAATAYELLTGRPPFWTGDIEHQILTARTPRLSEHAFENGVSNVVPGHIEDLWFAALSRDPSRRPDARELCAALAAFPGSHAAVAVEADQEPISLIPPTQDPTSPPKQKTAVEAAQEFEQLIPLDSKEPSTSQNRGVIFVSVALLLAGVAAAWQFARRSKVSRPEPRAHSATESVFTNPTSTNVSSTSNFPGLTILYLGRGPAFSYEYRPQKALALDTNAINHSVKFLRETGDPKANCCFIMTAGQTNHSVGSITYDLRTEPGFVVQDLQISQSTSHFTHGRIRGEYSLDRGRTFHQFFATPPYQGKSFGHGGETNLSSLNASNIVIRYVLHRYSGNDYNLQFLRDCNDSTAALRFSASIIKGEL